MNTNPTIIIQELKSIEEILKKNIQVGVMAKIERDIVLSKLQSVYEAVSNIDTSATTIVSTVSEPLLKEKTVEAEVKTLC